MAIDNIIPEGLFPISMAAPQLGNGITSDYINVSFFNMVWIVVHGRVAAATASVFTPLKAYAAAGTGATALTTNVPIWAGIITTSANTLTRQTDAAAFTTAATAGDHIVIFKIDPANLGAHATLGSYKYLGGTYVGLVADYIGVTMWAQPKYPSKVSTLQNYLV